MVKWTRVCFFQVTKQANQQILGSNKPPHCYSEEKAYGENYLLGGDIEREGSPCVLV